MGKLVGQACKDIERNFWMQEGSKHPGDRFWYKQGENAADCFVVAAMNYCLWLGVAPLDKEYLKIIGLGVGGSIINTDGVLEAMGLHLDKANPIDIVERGDDGLITLWGPNPNCNAHWVFFIRYNKSKCWLINGLFPDEKRYVGQFPISLVRKHVVRQPEQIRCGYVKRRYKDGDYKLGYFNDLHLLSPKLLKIGV